MPYGHAQPDELPMGDLMDAIVLAGGLGTRLRSVIGEAPKPLAPVGRKPFLEYLLAYWKPQGISHFHVTTSFRAEVFELWQANSQWHSSTTLCFEGEQPRGTGGALKWALQKCRPTETFLLINGDTFFTAPLQALERFHADGGSAITVGLAEVKDGSRYSSVVTGADGKIQVWEAEASSAPSLINGGVYVMSKERLAPYLDSFGGCFSLERDLIPMIVEQGEASALVCGDFFLDIGVPADYERAQVLIPRQADASGSP